MNAIKSLRSPPRQSTSSVLKANLDLLQPLCHGHDQQFHLAEWGGVGGSIGGLGREREREIRTVMTRVHKMDRWEIKGTAGSSEKE